MNERIARLVRAIQKTKRAVIEDQGVAKVHQLPARILRSVGGVHSVMQMNFKFAPTIVAMRRKTVDQSPVILFGGKEVSVNEGAPFLIAPRFNRAGILRTPTVHTALLLRKRGASPPVFGHN